MQKQNPRLIILFIFYFFLLSLPAQAGEDPLKSIRQLANRIYITSEDMVFHGAEGHADEIVGYGKKMIERAEVLLGEVETSEAPQLEKKKGKLIATIKAMLKKAKEAVSLGEQNKVRAAMTAARKASFRAKQTRQRLQMIR